MTDRKPSHLRTAVRSLVAALALSVCAGVAPALAQVATPHWYVITRTAPTYLHPGKTGWITMVIANLGDAPVSATSGNPVEITDTLPKPLMQAGEAVGEVVATEKMKGVADPGTNRSQDKPALSCEALPALSCKFVGTLPAGTAITAELPVEAKLKEGFLAAGETKGLGENVVTVTGGETEAGGEVPVKITPHQITVSQSESEVPFGVEQYELRPETEDGSLDAHAGSHPFQLTTTIAFNQTFMLETKGAPEFLPSVPALVKNIDTTLPPGLVGNTNTSIIPQCSDVDFSTVFEGNYNECPAETAVGVAVVTFKSPGENTGYATESIPVFNLVPAPGEPARFGFEFTKVPVTLGTSLKTGKGYAVEVLSKNTSELAEVMSAVVTVWGVPGAASHEEERGWQCLGGGWRYYAAPKHPKCEPAGPQPAQPYLTLPTTCGKALETSLQVESWLPRTKPEPVEAPESPTETLQGCAGLPFNPSIEVQAEQHDSSTPTGLKVVVDVPQASTLEPTLEETGKAEANIKETAVTFPAGVLANAGLALGLQACESKALGFELPEEEGTLNAQLENNMFTAAAASCPEASKIGNVKIVAPLIKEPLTGSVYLAKQDASPFKSPLVLYLIAEAKESGVRVKLAGEVKINQETGQETSTFRGTPPVPFEKLELTLPNEEEGRAANSTPPRCGQYPTNAAFTTFSEEGETPATTTPASSNPEGFEITHGVGGSPCPPSAPTPLSFTPSFKGGSADTQAAAFTPFSVTIGHADGQQALESIDMELPPGLAALLSEVTLCTEAQAEADACPAESLVGHTTSVSGLGDKVVTLDGELYLTGPLNANSKHGSGPFGLIAVTEAKVGPFDLGDVNVFSTINVNETTAAAIVNSSQIPQFVKGVPVQLKELNVVVERPAGKPFQFNPTNCEELKITGKLTGYEGTSSGISEPFFASNCATLPFTPKLTATVVGQGSKTNGTTFAVTVESPGIGQANIHKVDLTIPSVLPSRLTTIQKACVAAVFEANPASCDEGSVIGEGIVHTPVFKNPLRGPAYLVSRGAEFPDVEFVLQGEGVKILLDGKTYIHGGITYSKFESAPDAPFTKFETIFPAGPHSALTPSVPETEDFNLCRQSISLPTEITGQNGAFISETTPVTITGCSGVLPSKVVKPTKAQLLAKALKACKKDKKKSKRVACEKTARKKYGSKAKKAPKKGAKKSSKK